MDKHLPKQNFFIFGSFFDRYSSENRDSGGVLRNIRDSLQEEQAHRSREGNLDPTNRQNINRRNRSNGEVLGSVSGPFTETETPL